MFKKRNFKEIEMLMLKSEGHEFFDVDKVDKLLYDLCFAKSKLDIPTLLAVRAIFESTQITYKALEEAELIDPNEPYAVVELSRKKVKRLIRKSLSISKKSRSIEELGIDTLDNLSPDTVNLNEDMLRNIVREIVQEALDKAVIDLETHLTSQDHILEEQPQETPVETIMEEINAEEEKLVQAKTEDDQEEGLIEPEVEEPKPVPKKKASGKKVPKKRAVDSSSDSDEQITQEELEALKKK